MESEADALHATLLAKSERDAAYMAACADDQQAIKHDAGKLRYHLVPWKEFDDVVRILMEGEKQYGSFNWQQVKGEERYVNAAMRHLTAYISGDKIDKQWGYSHLAHIICNCLFQMWRDNNKENTHV